MPASARTRRGRGHHRADHSSPATTPLDQRRYFDFRAGMSPAELAARENVTLATIEKSILRMRTFAARNSQESAELATRELYLARLPDANQVFAEALVATRREGHIELVPVFDPLTRETTMQEREVFVDMPDHDTRLKATTALKNLLAGVQPKQPMVAVDARSQTNINNGQIAAGPNGHALSSESLIRQLRLERGVVSAPEIENAEVGVPTAETDNDDDEEESDAAEEAEAVAEEI